MVNGFNPKDPLLGTGPDQQRSLFDAFSHAAGQHPVEDVIGASVNMLVNAIRQTYPQRNMAEARWLDLAGRIRELMLSHYDSVTGRRKSIFPFDQIISVPLHKEKDGL